MWLRIGQKKGDITHSDMTGLLSVLIFVFCYSTTVVVVHFPEILVSRPNITGKLPKGQTSVIMISLGLF